MQQPLAHPADLATMRSLGPTVRTAQTLGIEWLDYAKQSWDDAAGTLERLAAAATPAEAWAIQEAYLRTTVERFAERSGVFGDLLAALVSGPTIGAVRPPGPGGPGRGA